MLNASFDRDSIIVKIFGVIAGLAAVGSIVFMVFGGMISSLFIAIANGLLAFICFADFEDEKMIFAASLGFIAVSDVFSLLAGKGTPGSTYSSIIISIIAHLGMIAYILWNRISRFKAIWIGAVIVADILWKTFMIPSAVRGLAGVLGYSGYTDSQMSLLIAIVVMASLVSIIPTAAVTTFLFTGILDYGN